MYLKVWYGYANKNDMYKVFHITGETALLWKQYHQGHIDDVSNEAWETYIRLDALITRLGRVKDYRHYEISADYRHCDQVFDFTEVYEQYNALNVEHYK